MNQRTSISLKTSILVCLLSMAMAAMADGLKVADLRVGTLHNPEGVDAPPQFSWKLTSDRRSTLQTAYRIVVSRSPKGKDKVFDTGFLKSDQSCGVIIPQLVLSPSTRYYWTVTVRDNHRRKAVSRDEARFDTGLMGSGWGGARWIKPSSENDITKNIARYTVETDLIILNDNASIVFATTGDKRYYMWQINTYDKGGPLLRRHIYEGGDSPKVSERRLRGFTKESLLHSRRHITIAVADKTVTTSIDGTPVDTFVCENGHAVPFGAVGMRVHNDPNQAHEEALFGNMRVTTSDASGHTTTVLDERFSDPADCLFPFPELVSLEGSPMCRMASEPGCERLMMQEELHGEPMLRKSFSLNKDIKSAKLYTTALGVYDVYVNGSRVGHTVADGTVVYDELKPGWTDYRSRVFYSSHDVTALLQQGDNVLGTVLTPGWWSGFISRGIYGKNEPAFMAKLVITYHDNTEETIVSDDTWLSSLDGPLRRSGIYLGEVYDARLRRDWTAPGYDCSRWKKVEFAASYKGKVEAQRGPAVRELADERRAPVSLTVYQGSKPVGCDYGMVNVVSFSDSMTVTTLKAGQTLIVDFGQNFAGVVDFKIKGRRGTRMKMRFAEMLNDTGEKNRANDGPGGSLYLENLRSAYAGLQYTFSGDEQGESYRPLTTFYGYRYCSITATADITLEHIEGVPLSSSYEDTGIVIAEDDMTNQLFSNIVWGQRSNLLSVPTDCPQRDERMGWTADTQVFSTTAMFNANVAGFYRKWLTDLRDGQRDDGAYPDIAPVCWTPTGNGAWADAGIIVPWNVYLMTGDKSAISEGYDSMERYMTWLSSQSSDGYKYDGAGTAYGDWLSFEKTDPRYVSVAYYAYDAKLMARMSRVLSTAPGDRYDLAAKKYDRLFDDIKTEYQRRFMPDGVLPSPSQTQCLLALQFGLYRDDAQKQWLTDKLRQLITDNGEKLGTGFVGTSVINMTLSEAGLADKAYNLLLQCDCPSWMYSIDQGATTVWERWNSYTREKGFGDKSMNSFNHYAYGAVGEWMYRRMAGINPDDRRPGFKHIVLCPEPDMRTVLPHKQHRIKGVMGIYDSPYGDILADWVHVEDGIEYTFSVPANTTATLYLPVADEITAVKFTDARPEYKGFKDGRKIYELGSGDYEVKVKNY